MENFTATTMLMAANTNPVVVFCGLMYCVVQYVMKNWYWIKEYITILYTWGDKKRVTVDTHILLKNGFDYFGEVPIEMLHTMHFIWRHVNELNVHAFRTFHMINHILTVPLVSSHKRIRLAPNIFMMVYIKEEKRDTKTSHDVEIKIHMELSTDIKGKFEDIYTFLTDCAKEYDFDKRIKEIKILDFQGIDNDANLKVYPIFLSEKFESSRTFDNCHFQGKDVLMRRIDNVVTEGGSLSLLLHGPPGSGKTSIIKAIANHTKRHIISVRFNQKNVTRIRTILKTIMSTVRLGGENIPLDQRVYVFEEADSWLCYLRREPEMKTKQHQSEYGSLTDFLDIMDGLVEYNGRICIMTTNYGDKVDSALKRPGRFEPMYIGYMTDDDVVKMYMQRFGAKLSVVPLSGVWTQASLCSLFDSYSCDTDYVNRCLIAGPQKIDL